MPGLEPKKTVVPLDFSDLSFAALERAVEIVGDGGEIEVIHVLAELSAMEPGNLYGTLTTESRVDSVISHMRKRIADAGLPNLSMHAAVGDPGREITKFAERVGADLIVIPSHGYGFFKHMMLGSVAERVVRLAHCPVLVLRS